MQYLHATVSVCRLLAISPNQAARRRLMSAFEHIADARWRLLCSLLYDLALAITNCHWWIVRLICLSLKAFAIIHQ